MSKQKAIIYIGASIPQLVGIQTALDLGLQVVVTDRNPNAPGRALASQFECLDATDIDGFMSLAARLEKKYDVVGIYALEDYAAETAACVAEKLNLPFPSRDAIRQSVCKHLSAIKWQQAHLPVPKTVVIRGDQPIETGIEQVVSTLKFPLIVKPSDSWNSFGVRQLTTADADYLYHAISDARTFSHDVIVQEYITGQIYNVDALFADGDFYPITSFERLNYEISSFHFKQIIEPSSLPSEMTDALFDGVEKAARSIGIDVGPITADIMVSGNKFYILEISTHFHSIYQTSLRTSGICLPLKAWFAYCAGLKDWRDILYSISPTGYSGIHAYRISKSGTVKSVNGINHVKQITGIHQLDLRKAPGSKVSGTAENPVVTAILWGAAKNREETIKILSEAARSIHFNLE